MRISRFSALFSLVFPLFTLEGGLTAQDAVRFANGGTVRLEGVPRLSARSAELVDAYRNVRRARFAEWHRREGIYILTAFANRTQIHHVPRPGHARRQVSFVNGTLDGDIQRRPGQDELLIRMETSGRETHQLYLLTPGTSRLRLLTDGRSWHSKAAWSPDGSRIALTTTRRNGRSKDILVIPVDDPSSAFYALKSSSDDWWGVGEWHPTADRLLLAHRHGNRFDTVLLDLATGRQRTITLPAGDALSGARFTADGTKVRTVVPATNGRRFALLDLAGGALTAEGPALPPNMAGPYDVSEDGRYIALTTNDDGASTLHLLDTTNSILRRLDVGLENALVGDLRFSPDGARLAFSVNAAQTPSDAYTITLNEEAEHVPTRWTCSEVGGLDTNRFVAPQLIRYPTFDQVKGKPRQISAFLYRPRGKGPHPVIISLHGGPFYQFRPVFNGEFQMWIGELGAAVVAPNVRGSSGYGAAFLALDDGRRREGAVKDIGALLDWIRRDPDLDEEHVVVHGGSYGGYLVLASLVHFPDKLCGGVCIAGISNFVSFIENAVERHRPSQRAEFGDERDPEMRSFLQSISPLNHVDRMRAPLLVAHGRNDPRCPVGEADRIVAALRERGRDVWYMRALNDGHFFTEKGNRRLLQSLTVEFLERRFGR